MRFGLYEYAFNYQMIRNSWLFFHTAIDSKLRGCDLVKLKVSDISQMGRVYPRAMILQKKTQVPVQFEITKATRDSIQDYLSSTNSIQNDF